MQTKLFNKQRILLLLSASLTYYISRNQIIISKIESLFNIKNKINNSFTEVGIIIHILFTFFIQCIILYCIDKLNQISA